MKLVKYFLILIINFSCNDFNTEPQNDKIDDTVSLSDTDITADTLKKVKHKKLNITSVSAREFVLFAKTLTGIPYKYASTDPASGFDCSGFISYVFNHFNLTVPRSSVDFTNVGKQINLRNAEEGDLILFTGINDSIRIVGHMGIVTENADTLKFIHATSGRANSVTITSFTEHYKKRFVKIIRVFSNDTFIGNE